MLKTILIQTEEEKALIQASYLSWNGNTKCVNSALINYQFLNRISAQLITNGWVSLHRHNYTNSEPASGYRHTDTTNWPGNKYCWKEVIIIQLEPDLKKWINAQYKSVRKSLKMWCKPDINIGIDRINHRIQVAITSETYDAYLHCLVDMYPKHILKAQPEVIFNQQFIKERIAQELKILEVELGADPQALFLILRA